MVSNAFSSNFPGNQQDPEEGHELKSLLAAESEDVSVDEESHSRTSKGCENSSSDRDDAENMKKAAVRKYYVTLFLTATSFFLLGSRFGSHLFLSSSSVVPASETQPALNDGLVFPSSFANNTIYLFDMEEDRNHQTGNATQHQNETSMPAAEDVTEQLQQSESKSKSEEVFESDEEIAGTTSVAQEAMKAEDSIAEATKEVTAETSEDVSTSQAPDITSSSAETPDESTEIESTGEMGSLSVPAITKNYQNIDESLFVAHVPYEHDLHFRRVCAKVHSSLLCMIIRLPFPALEQDPNFEYPHPFDDRYYGLENKLSRFTRPDELEECRSDPSTVSLSIDERVKHCLESLATQNEGAVLALWTRRRLDSTETDFYGVNMSPQQGQRIDKFFDKHVILVLGASPTPPVTQCLVDLFGGCISGGIKPVSALCKGHENNNRVRQLGNTNSYPKLDLNQTFIGCNTWYPQDKSHGRWHRLQQNLTMTLKSIGFAREPGFTELRKFSIIIEYPLAHVQNQEMIDNEWEEVEKIQKGMPRMVVDMTSDLAKRELAEMGYELGHIIAYDGMPQFFPSKTAAYSFIAKTGTTEEEFLNSGGFPGWVPDYGSQCRGPLPPSNRLKYVNGLARQAFEDFGFDMNYYGQTWEFANQLFFQMEGWGSHGLDCTHAFMGSTIWCVHKYFLMAMVDDHFDDSENAHQ